MRGTNLFLRVELLPKTACLPLFRDHVKESVGRNEDDHAPGNDIGEVEQYLSKLRHLIGGTGLYYHVCIVTRGVLPGSRRSVVGI